MAVVLTPESPTYDWLTEVDKKVKDARGFIAGQPIVLDLSAVTLSRHAIEHLVGELERRGIRIIGIENVDAAQTGGGLPPLMRSSQRTRADVGAAAPPAQATNRTPTTLLLDKPVRSGQSIFFPDGDVTIIGSVASGAELVAGGSVHVYGTLRGRVMAGWNGNSCARIFCSKIEAELLAINGYYLTADLLDAHLCDRPVQAWLDGNELKIAAVE